MKDYYVYELQREDGTPFYIGKGRGARWLAHEQQARWPSTMATHKVKIIRDMIRRGVPVPKRKIAENLSNIEACALEISLISQIGREPKGPLVNATNGGDGLVGLGADAILAIKTKLTGRKLSLEHREHIAAGGRGRRHSPETIAKMAAAGSRRGCSAEFIAKGVQARIGKKLSAAHSAKLSAIRRGKKCPWVSAKLKGCRFSADHRAKISASLTGHVLSDETRAKISAAKLGKPVHTEAARATMSETRLGRKHSAEARAKISATKRARAAASRLSEAGALLL